MWTIYRNIAKIHVCTSIKKKKGFLDQLNVYINNKHDIKGIFVTCQYLLYTYLIIKWKTCIMSNLRHSLL